MKTIEQLREQLRALAPQAGALAQGTVDDKVQAENILTAMQEMQAQIDELEKSTRKTEGGAAGDAARQELREAQQHDMRTGKFQYDSSGAVTFPTLQRVWGRLEANSPVPSDVAQHPFAKYIHIPTEDPELRQIQELHDIAIMARHIRRRPNPMIDGLYHEALTKAAIQEPGTSTAGGSWVPTFFSAQLASDIFGESSLLQVFPHVPMPRATCTFPALTGRSTARRAPGATDTEDWQVPNVTPSTITTASRTFQAEKVMAIVGIGDEIEEDAILSMGSEVRNRMLKDLSFTLEDAIVNGSTSLTDLDNAGGTKLWTDTQDVRHCWDGLRKDALVTTSTSVDSGTLATAAFTGTIASMGNYGFATEQKECIWIVGVDAYALVLGLAELKTLDVYGPRATAITGELMNIYGIPVIQSYNVYGPNHGTGLNASGVYDGSTVTKTCMLLVNRSRYMIGDRREIQVESERSALAGMNYFVVSWRGDFQKMVTSAHPTASVMYNIA